MSKITISVIFATLFLSTALTSAGWYLISDRIMDLQRQIYFLNEQIKSDSVSGFGEEKKSDFELSVSYDFCKKQSCRVIR